MPLSGEAGRCCLQAVRIHTSTSPSQRCKSSRFWLLLPCCSFYRITMYPSQQQYCGSRRHCWLIKGPGLKLLSGSPVKQWNPQTPEGNISGRLVWKLDPWSLCRQNLPLKWQFLFLLCAVGYLKGRNICFQMEKLVRLWLREEGMVCEVGLI